MEASQPNFGCHYQLQQRAMPFWSFHELPKSSLGWCKVAKITATSGSRVAHYHLTLWKQANRILDVTTSYNREPCLFGPFTNFQNRCLGGVRSPRSQPRVGQGSHITIRHYGSKPTEFWMSLPATTESHAFLVLSRTSKIVAWVV
jgi:hypothetical protein